MFIVFSVAGQRCLLAAGFYLLSAFCGAWAGDGPVVKAKIGPLPLANSYDLPPKTRRSVSGVACSDRSAELGCLIVFDEGTQARFAHLAAGAYSALAPHVELQSGVGELDLEAAATDGVWYFAAGSHSVKRKSCAPNPDSRFLARFRVDPNPSSGRPKDLQTTSRLWELLSRDKTLGAGNCLGDGGLNIEGMAVKGGRLFFGLRGPARDGSAIVFAVDADALFDGRDARPSTHALPLGPGRGVRDLVAVSDGLLVLAGPDDNPANAGAGFVLLFWDGVAAQPKSLATLSTEGVVRADAVTGCNDKEVKLEALAVLSETPDLYRVIVLSDGLCDGGPLIFDVARPR